MVGDRLPGFIVVVILHYEQILNYYIVLLKGIQSYVSYNSITKNPQGTIERKRR